MLSPIPVCDVVVIAADERGHERFRVGEAGGVAWQGSPRGRPGRGSRFLGWPVRGRRSLRQRARYFVPPLWAQLIAALIIVGAKILCPKSPRQPSPGESVSSFAFVQAGGGGAAELGVP